MALDIETIDNFIEQQKDFIVDSYEENDVKAILFDDESMFIKEANDSVALSPNATQALRQMLVGSAMKRIFKEE